jgi:hypothetical protein
MNYYSTSVYWSAEQWRLRWIFQWFELECKCGCCFSANSVSQFWVHKTIYELNTLTTHTEEATAFTRLFWLPNLSMVNQKLRELQCITFCINFQIGRIGDCTSCPCSTGNCRNARNNAYVLSLLALSVFTLQH